jgi:hypothetical protein
LTQSGHARKVIEYALGRPTLDQLLPDESLGHTLSVEELERIREAIRDSVDRTQAELDRIEELIVVAKLREERRQAALPREMAQE